MKNTDFSFACSAQSAKKNKKKNIWKLSLDSGPSVEATAWDNSRMLTMRNAADFCFRRRTRRSSCLCPDVKWINARRETGLSPCWERLSLNKCFQSSNLRDCRSAVGCESPQESCRPQQVSVLSCQQWWRSWTDGRSVILGCSTRRNNLVIKCDVASWGCQKIQRK